MKYISPLLRRTEFLRIAGCSPALSFWLSCSFVAAALLYWWFGEAAPQLLYGYLVSVPLLAGTGMLDAAREGRFDLLIAQGASRGEIWLTAVTRAVLFHTLLAGLIAVAAGQTFSDSPVASVTSALVIGLGNASIGFAGGIVRPAAGFGFVWLIARILFIVIPQGARLYAHVIEVHTDLSSPVLWKLLVAALLLPEFTLRKNVPAVVSALFLAFALGLLLVSFFAFQRANLTGRRR